MKFTTCAASQTRGTATGEKAVHAVGIDELLLIGVIMAIVSDAIGQHKTFDKCQIAGG